MLVQPALMEYVLLNLVRNAALKQSESVIYNQMTNLIVSNTPGFYVQTTSQAGGGFTVIWLLPYIFFALLLAGVVFIIVLLKRLWSRNDRKQ
jgi:hypothetical protein